MAPLLLALLPFLALPTLLAVAGHGAALPFAGFAVGLFLLVVAARIAIGVARLPLLCLGGLGAAGAASMPLMIVDLDWSPAVALAVVPVVGLGLAGLLWAVLRASGRTVAMALSLLALLPLAVLPSLTFDADANLPAPGLNAGLAWPVGVGVLLLVIAQRFAAAPVVRLHEAAREAGLPLDGQGLDLRLWRALALVLAAAIATMGGGLLALGPFPVIGADPFDWAALSIALAAIGRLGGVRLGAALLAALPLALLPKLITTIAPGFLDLTLAVALAALAMQLVVRPDGSLAWQPAAESPMPAGSPTLQPAEE